MSCKRRLLLLLLLLLLLNLLHLLHLKLHHHLTLHLLHLLLHLLQLLLLVGVPTHATQQPAHGHHGRRAVRWHRHW